MLYFKRDYVFSESFKEDKIGESKLYPNNVPGRSYIRTGIDRTSIG